MRIGQTEQLRDLAGRQRLRYAAYVYGFGTALHTVDHFRRGAGSVSWELVEAGTLGTILAAIALTLIFTRHALAPIAAAAVGIPHGLGIFAVHWLPRWSVLSDSFFGNTMSPMSWVAVALEVTGALAVGFIGLSVWRHEQSLHPAAV